MEKPAESPEKKEVIKLLGHAIRTEAKMRVPDISTEEAMKKMDQGVEESIGKNFGISDILKSDLNIGELNLEQTQKIEELLPGFKKLSPEQMGRFFLETHEIVKKLKGGPLSFEELDPEQLEKIKKVVPGYGDLSPDVIREILIAIRERKTKECAEKKKEEKRPTTFKEWMDDVWWKLKKGELPLKKAAFTALLTAIFILVPLIMYSQKVKSDARKELRAAKKDFEEKIAAERQNIRGAIEEVIQKTGKKIGASVGKEIVVQVEELLSPKTSSEKSYLDDSEEVDLKGATSAIVGSFDEKSQAFLKKLLESPPGQEKIKKILLAEKNKRKEGRKT
ncbi:MAG TPA: hypothetical protein ENI70_00100, partial [Candidatus Peregrinibacteria bacterium]|nr:hypothetical protein [Candidatus Peregrinibacteria bacterium]